MKRIVLITGDTKSLRPRDIQGVIDADTVITDVRDLDNEDECHITWIATDAGLNTLKCEIAVTNTVCLSCTTPFHDTQQEIESCFKLRGIDVLTFPRFRGLFDEWLSELSGVAGCVSLVPNVDQRAKLALAQNVVVSNLCWGLVDPTMQDCSALRKRGWTHVNVVLTPDLFDRKRAIQVRDAYARHGLSIVSINGLFHDAPNHITTSKREFVAQFTRAIEVANVLGAKQIIYGAPMTRRISAVKKINLEECERETRRAFVSVMRQVGMLASHRGVEIIMKPSVRENCVYLMSTDPETQALVADIRSPTVTIGAMRTPVYTDFDTFRLVEFAGRHDRFHTTALKLLDLLI